MSVYDNPNDSVISKINDNQKEQAQEKMEDEAIFLKRYRLRDL